MRPARQIRAASVTAMLAFVCAVPRSSVVDGVATRDVPSAAMAGVRPVLSLPAVRSPGDAPANLRYFGGPVMATSTTYAIFWLPPGYRLEPSGDDLRFEGLIERYLRDVGGTPFYGMLTQYSSSPGGQPVQGGPILNSSNFGGSYVDTAPYPRRASADDPLLASDFESEIERVARLEHWPGGASSLFLVYTGAGTELCFAPGQSCTADSACAFHDFAPFLGAYAVIADVESHALCSTPVSANGDSVADAAISKTSHEQFEAVTDPQVCTGWAFDCGTAMEIGDVCQWGFGPIYAAGGDVTLHGHPYYLQEEWSNADGRCELPLDDTPPMPTSTPISSRTAMPTSTATAEASTTLTPKATSLPTSTTASGPSFRSLRAVEQCARSNSEFHGRCGEVPR